MAHTASLGLFDCGFRHWLETHEDSIERLTGHVSESWNRRADRKAPSPRSRSDGGALPRAEMDAKVTV